MSNPLGREDNSLCCTHMEGSTLASQGLPFIHKMGAITSIWDETEKYEV